MNSSWPMFQGGPNRTGHQSVTGPQDSVTKKWCFQTDFHVSSSPAVVDNIAFVGSNDNYLYALTND